MNPPSAHADRSNEVFKLSRDPQTFEVTIESDITLEDYQNLTPAEDWEKLLSLGEENKGKTVCYINPTMEGGGVAMLRPPLVHLMKMLGVDAHWFVMSNSLNDGSNPFLFTKQMHNIIQRRSGDERINEAGKELHQQWNEENAEVLMNQPALVNADVIVIDDPQPAPLKKYLDEVNPDAKIVWRNHIDNDGELMNDPSTPQGEVASYVFDECDIASADAMLYHPVAQFMHPKYADKTYFVPATIEPFDDLNRELTAEEIKSGAEFINNEITKVNTRFSKEGREEDMQSLIDLDRNRLILVARFDESKGMDKAMRLGVETFDLLTEQGVEAGKLPQLVLIGNGSVDDPSGVPMYEEMLRMRREEYPEYKEDIIVMRVRHNYAAMNALMYPHFDAKGRESSKLFGLQTSDAEGCETRITDWIRHGVPVMISNRGGMSLQVKEGESGFVLDYDAPECDIPRGAQILSQLLQDDEAYAKLRASTREQGEQFNSREFMTVANCMRMLRVFARLDAHLPADKRWLVSEISQETTAPQGAEMHTSAQEHTHEG